MKPSIKKSFLILGFLTISSLAYANNADYFGKESYEALKSHEINQDNLNKLGQIRSQAYINKSSRDLTSRFKKSNIEKIRTQKIIAEQKLKKRSTLSEKEQQELEAIIAKSNMQLAKLEKEYSQLLKENKKIDQEYENINKFSSKAIEGTVEDEEFFNFFKQYNFDEPTSAQDNKLAHQSSFFDYGNNDNENYPRKKSNSKSYGSSHNSNLQYNNHVDVIDSVISNLNEKGANINIYEEEEEEEVMPLTLTPGHSLRPYQKQMESVLKQKDGILVPNQPLALSVNERETLRAHIEAKIKSAPAPMNIVERDFINALLFNYGIQVLDNNQVITLDVYQPTQQTNMLAPDVKMPEGAKKVIRSSSVDKTTEKNDSILVPENEIKNFME